MGFLIVNYIMVGRWTRSCGFFAFGDIKFEKAVVSIAGQIIVMILENNSKDKNEFYFHYEFLIIYCWIKITALRIVTTNGCVQYIACS